MASKPRPCGQVLVVEDDAPCRELIVAVLETEGYEPIEAATGREALARARASRPRLVLLDIELPDVSGYEVCRTLREEYGDDLPIIFVSGTRTESFDRVAGFLIGADDYVGKPFAPDELLARVRVQLRRSRDAGLDFGLTPKEREVLELLAEGLKQAEIARRLVVTPKTVGTHIERILRKLGVHSRAEAVAVAYQRELVHAGS